MIVLGSATAEVFSKANWHVVGVDKKRTAEVPAVSHFIQADTPLENILALYIAEREW